MTYDNSNSFQPHEHARALRRGYHRGGAQASRHDLTRVRSACVRRAFGVRLARVLKPTCLQLATKKRPGRGFSSARFSMWFTLFGILIYVKDRGGKICPGQQTVHKCAIQACGRSQYQYMALINKYYNTDSQSSRKP